MERMTRLLYGIAALLLLLGLVLRIVPASVGANQRVAARTPESGIKSRRAVSETSAAEAVIIEGNIFSASRAAPRVRYTPPDLAPSAQKPARARPRPGSAGLRLFGTVSGTAALIDADPAVPGAEVYQVGDVVGGRRIVAVSESTVVLEGAAGRIVLRLRPDQPPPQ
jgi:hypothetical protein